MEEAAQESSGYLILRRLMDNRCFENAPRKAFYAEYHDYHVEDQALIAKAVGQT
ncbi:MAG: hypothetical protein S4CHLAM123_05470 [Chlamydiales bacterium]|nr:hypothetical protein [Chlamydiales bacterium]